MKIQIITKPKARNTKVVQITNSVYEVAVTAMPIGGKANEAVIIALADHFHVHKNQVVIFSGFTSVNKTVSITCL
jgi:hypothetical protein